MSEATGNKRSSQAIKTVPPMDCQECKMLVEPGNAFHPWLFCWLRKRGVLNPAEFLDLNGFQRKPTDKGGGVSGD